MTDNQKVHLLLKYIVDNFEEDGYLESDKVPESEIGLSHFEVKHAMKILINNGDAEESITKESASRHIICLDFTFETNVAYNTEKYLKLDEKENHEPISITSSNVHIGNNSGNLSQVSDSLEANIKATNAPKPNDIKQRPIIAMILKFWWLLLIPVLVGIILMLIEHNYFK
tara:strand:- start:315 stop:827 length:513 start_codon:yes stop_codon:yes gene_type:complete